MESTCHRLLLPFQTNSKYSCVNVRKSRVWPADQLSFVSKALSGCSNDNDWTPSLSNKTHQTFLARFRKRSDLSSLRYILWAVLKPPQASTRHNSGNTRKKIYNGLQACRSPCQNLLQAVCYIHETLGSSVKNIFVCSTQSAKRVDTRRRKISTTNFTYHWR